MPLYSFECKQCKHEFEAMMSMKDADEMKLKCEKCGCESERIISVVPPVHSTWKMWKT